MDVAHLPQPRLRHIAQHLGPDPNAGVEPTVTEYLETPPSRDKLRDLIAKAGLTARQALREKGTPYAELGLSNRTSRTISCSAP